MTTQLYMNEIKYILKQLICIWYYKGHKFETKIIKGKAGFRCNRCTLQVIVTDENIKYQTIEEALKDRSSWYQSENDKLQQSK